MKRRKSSSDQSPLQPDKKLAAKKVATKGLQSVCSPGVSQALQENPVSLARSQEVSQDAAAPRKSGWCVFLILSLLCCPTFAVHLLPYFAILPGLSLKAVCKVLPSTDKQCTGIDIPYGH